MKRDERRTPPATNVVASWLSPLHNHPACLPCHNRSPGEVSLIVGTAMLRLHRVTARGVTKPLLLCVALQRITDSPAARLFGLGRLDFKSRMRRKIEEQEVLVEEEEEEVEEEED